MKRLNQRAFSILREELRTYSNQDQLSSSLQAIVLRRLERMRSLEGTPASLAELREAIVDLFPDFNQKVIRQAAAANQPPGVWSKLKWIGLIGASSAGMLWLLNLPYPMIRWPVAKNAPILLLPSYLSMNYHYRQAIAQVEQADQLVNQATSPADFELGAQKAKQAQKHLDALPVWFLGYWPKYTLWLGWQFTLDEFKSARTTVGRMEAQLFQENNAQKELTIAEETLNQAKQNYQQAQTTEERGQAISSWQAALDAIEQLPPETLAGKRAKTKLPAYQRDFKQVASLAAAKELAMQAEKAIPQGQQTTLEWQQAANLWQQAINQLKQIPSEDPSYLEAQKLYAAYQSKLETVLAKRETVVSPRTANLIGAAQQFAWKAANAAQNPPHSAPKWQQIGGLWQQALKPIEQIPPEDPGYLEAQKLLATYQNNLGQIQLRQQAEANSVKTLELAQSQIQRLIDSTSVNADSASRGRTISQLQGIINQLEKVQNGTTVYPKAQELLLAAKKKLKQIESPQ
ncbi:MAG: hypothetical protein WA919_27325 [Coleofasciculaceae cyanobacterium]